MKKAIEIKPCPICDSKKSVGRVMSYNNKNVYHVFYCRNCYVEFDRKGTLRCPEYV